jgi:ribonuclease PH
VLESVIALEDLANLMLTVTVLVMHSNGSELSEAINASYAALVHSGVRLKNHVLSMTFAVRPENILTENPTTD